MSKQKTKVSGESKDARFRRVAEPRVLKMLYQVDRLTGMVKSPTYKIFDVDAQKILDKAQPIIDAFITAYKNIADNVKVEEEEKTLDKIF